MTLSNIPPEIQEISAIAPEQLATVCAALSAGLYAVDDSESTVLEQSFVYLDSSGLRKDDGYSIIARCPRSFHKGNINNDEDREHLAQALQDLGQSFGSLDSEVEKNSDLPEPGLYGCVSYHGEFTFALFPYILIYDHHQGTWLERGALQDRDAYFLPLLEALKNPENGGASKVTIGETSAHIEATEFKEMVKKAKEYIAAGDIYQVNLSRCYSSSYHCSPAEPGEGSKGANFMPLYSLLREISPAPHSAYLSLDGTTVLSSSPECFLDISGRRIRTKPIKGTRPTKKDPEQDRQSAYDLISSSKELSELVMITDLERNDLGKVCEFGSVKVAQLHKIQRFAQVYHLVSTVEGKLEEGISSLEALSSCFPGGSITGAPKKRAMEIIEELEPEERGIYTGAIGYLGCDQRAQLNIAIRSMVAKEGMLSFHTGAGIVADSDPMAEYEETCTKALGLLQAIEEYRS